MTMPTTDSRDEQKLVSLWKEHRHGVKCNGESHSCFDPQEADMFFRDVLILIHAHDIELLALIEKDVIGRDDNIGADPEWPWSKVNHRDQLRAEQRQALSRLVEQHKPNDKEGGDDASS